MASSSYTIELKGEKPFVVIRLKQYEAMLEYMDELEDRADIKERSIEENILWPEVKKQLRRNYQKNNWYAKRVHHYF